MTELTFRHYDNALGRFVVPDPLTEQAVDWTPYRFGFNNPVVYNDPLGLFEININWDRIPENGGSTWHNNNANNGDGHGYDFTREDAMMMFEPFNWESTGTNRASLNEVVLNYRDSNSYVDGINSIIEQINARGYNYSDLRLSKAAFGLSPAIGDLSGWDKTFAEIQDNMPWLFGRRTSDDGRFYIDAGGNTTGWVPTSGIAPGPSGPLKAAKAVKNTSSLIVKFSQAQKMAWWTSSTKKGISASQAAQNMGGALVKQFKAIVDTGGRSGEHGRAFLKAGQELIRQANSNKAGHLPDMIKAMKTAGDRLIRKGRSINHKM